MNKKTEAKCTNNMLTVGFHAANPPLIWRFDLERNHSFTLALQGDEGEWELGVTTPKGDFYPVAHFVAREDAEEAFTKVEKILSQRRSGTGAILRALGALAAIAFIIMVGVILFGLYVNRAPQRATPLVSASPASPPLIEEGVPQAADDVLKPPAP